MEMSAAGKGNSVELSTFNKYDKGFVIGHRTEEKNGKSMVTFVWCKLCTVYKDEILKNTWCQGAIKRSLEAYINGTNSVSKWAIDRHIDGNGHQWALKVDMSKPPDQRFFREFSEDHEADLEKDRHDDFRPKIWAVGGGALNGEKRRVDQDERRPDENMDLSELDKLGHGSVLGARVEEADLEGRSKVTSVWCRLCAKHQAAILNNPAIATDPDERLSIQAFATGVDVVSEMVVKSHFAGGGHRLAVDLDQELPAGERFRSCEGVAGEEGEGLDDDDGEEALSSSSAAAAADDDLVNRRLSIELSTFLKYGRDDVIGFRAEDKSGGRTMVTFVWCKLCEMHKADVLKSSSCKGVARRSAEAYINGTSSVSKWSIDRHLESNAHLWALELDRGLPLDRRYFKAVASRSGNGSKAPSSVASRDSLAGTSVPSPVVVKVKSEAASCGKTDDQRLFGPGNSVELDTFKMYGKSDIIGYKTEQKSGRGSKDMVTFVWCKLCSAHKDEILLRLHGGGEGDGLSASKDFADYTDGTNCVSWYSIDQHLQSIEHNLAEQIESTSAVHLQQRRRQVSPVCNVFLDSRDESGARPAASGSSIPGQTTEVEICSTDQLVITVNEAGQLIDVTEEFAAKRSSVDSNEKELLEFLRCNFSPVIGYRRGTTKDNVLSVFCELCSQHEEAILKHPRFRKDKSVLAFVNGTPFAGKRDVENHLAGKCHQWVEDLENSRAGTAVAAVGDDGRVVAFEGHHEVVVVSSSSSSSASPATRKRPLTSSTTSKKPLSSTTMFLDNSLPIPAAAKRNNHGQSLPAPKKAALGFNSTSSWREAGNTADLKLIRTAYELALNPNVPLSTFSVMVACQKRNGAFPSDGGKVTTVPGKGGRSSAISCIECIAQSVREACGAILASQSFHSLVVDTGQRFVVAAGPDSGSGGGSSAASSNQGFRVGLVSVVCGQSSSSLSNVNQYTLGTLNCWDSDATGHSVSTAFSSPPRVMSWRASVEDSIYRAVGGPLNQFWEKLVMLVVDGADEDKPACQDLLDIILANVPWAVPINRSVGRMEMAFHADFEMQSYFDVCDSVYTEARRILKTSSKLRSDLWESRASLGLMTGLSVSSSGTSAEGMGRPLSRISRSRNAVRSRIHAMKALLRIWPALVASLQGHLLSEAATLTMVVSQEEISHLLERLRSYEFLCKVSCYLDLLMAIAPLEDDVFMTTTGKNGLPYSLARAPLDHAMTAVNKVNQTLTQLEGGEDWESTCLNMHSCLKDEDGDRCPGIYLKADGEDQESMSIEIQGMNFDAEARETATSNKRAIALHLRTSLFSDSGMASQLAASSAADPVLAFYDPRTWSASRDTEECLISLAGKFSIPLEASSKSTGFNVANLMEEFKQFRNSSKKLLNKIRSMSDVSWQEQSSHPAEVFWKESLSSKGKHSPSLAAIVDLLGCISLGSSYSAGSVGSLFRIINMILARELRRSCDPKKTLALVDDLLVIMTNDQNWSDQEREDILNRAAEIYADRHQNAPPSGFKSGAKKAKVSAQNLPEFYRDTESDSDEDEFYDTGS